ncbi:MAG: hypothetical protein WCK89_05465 [bacterium]
MSKHTERRERRERYHRMLDAELDAEKPFIHRVVDSINSGGIDFAPDGRAIRADFWRYIRSRQQSAPHKALAGLSLVERAVGSLKVRRA